MSMRGLCKVIGIVVLVCNIIFAAMLLIAGVGLLSPILIVLTAAVFTVIMLALDEVLCNQHEIYDKLKEIENKIEVNE